MSAPLSLYHSLSVNRPVPLLSGLHCHNKGVGIANVSAVPQQLVVSHLLPGAVNVGGQQHSGIMHLWILMWQPLIAPMMPWMPQTLAKSISSRTSHSLPSLEQGSLKVSAGKQFKSCKKTNRVRVSRKSEIEVYRVNMLHSENDFQLQWMDLAWTF